MTQADSSWFESAVRTMLREQTVMTLATNGPEGPWAADVYFAAKGWELYFLSSPRSRHAAHLAEAATCAATIHPQAAPSWREITGLQLAGRARRVSIGREYGQVVADYLREFPFAREVIAAPGDSLVAAARAVPYVFAPDWVRLIDNSRGFGRPFAARIGPEGTLGTPEREKE